MPKSTRAANMRGGLAAAAFVIAAAGCTSVPPDGTLIVRAVPSMGELTHASAKDAGVIVSFEEGDRIALRLDVDSPLGHVETADGGPAGHFVVDQDFWIWSGRSGTSMSFDEGRTWESARRALDGAFGVQWLREATGRSEITVSIDARPR